MKITGLAKTIEKKLVLSDISFQLVPGEIVGLVGRNGTGKTTLMRTITNYYLPDAGTVAIDGESLVENLTLREQVFYLDGQHHFLNNLTPVEIANYYQTTYDQFDLEKYYSLLSKNKLSLKHKFQNYSKGMQGLFRMILAFSTGATYILLDEPLDGLDIIVKKQVIRLLVNEVSINQRGILISSHNLNELENLADRVLILKNNQIINDYHLEDIREHTKKIQMVFASKQIPAIVKDHCTILQVRGRVIIALFNELTPSLEKEIQAIQPVLFEELPLSLEDLFASNLTEETDYVLFD